MHLHFIWKLCFNINIIYSWSTTHLSSTVNRKHNLFLIDSCFQVVRSHSHLYFQPRPLSQTTNLDFQWTHDNPYSTWTSTGPTVNPLSLQASFKIPESPFSFDLMLTPFTKCSKIKTFTQLFSSFSSDPSCCKNSFKSPHSLCLQLRPFHLLPISLQQPLK